MIVALGSVRGSPGVSSWAMLLAAAWPVDNVLERVILEADVDGGVGGARYAVGVEPGVQALVSDLRHTDDPSGPLASIGRRLGDGAWLVPGPESAEAARRLWAADRVSRTVAAALAQDRERVWLCDLGRVTAGSPTAPLASAASLMLLFCRDQPADVVQIPARVEALAQVTSEVGVVVGSPAYELYELASFFGCRQVWIVPGADDLVELSRQVWSSRAARRSPVWRAAVSLAVDVTVPVMYRVSLGPEVGRE